MSRTALVVALVALHLQPAWAAPPMTAALERSSPGIEDAAGHVDAAEAAIVAVRWPRGVTVAPEVLVAMAWVESRYTTTGVSRLECDDAGACVRRTGPWPGPKPARFHGPYFCGYHGAKARTWAGCRALGAEGLASYHRAALHLREWLRGCARDREARRHRDRLSCALAGYNRGWAGARAGRTGYSSGVLDRARRLSTGWPMRNVGA